MNRLARLVLVASCVLAVAGCGSSPLMRQTRDASAGIGEGEEIATLLVSYGHHSGVGRFNQEVEADRAEVERLFDECLRREMVSARQELRFVAPQALRQAAFPGQAVGEPPIAPETILGRIADAGLGQHAGMARLRYLILLDGTQWDSGAAPAASATTSGGGGAMGATWYRIVSVRATVIDLAHRRIAGTLSAYAEGERFLGVGVIYIFPFPLFFTTIPEAAEVCRKLGQDLARFLTE
jgi:hypothetical protein